MTTAAVVLAVGVAAGLALGCLLEAATHPDKLCRHCYPVRDSSCHKCGGRGIHTTPTAEVIRYLRSFWP